MFNGLVVTNGQSFWPVETPNLCLRQTLLHVNYTKYGLKHTIKICKKHTHTHTQVGTHIFLISPDVDLMSCSLDK